MIRVGEQLFYMTILWEWMVSQKKQDMSEYKLIHLGEITLNQTLNSSKWVSECRCAASVSAKRKLIAHHA